MRKPVLALLIAAVLVGPAAGAHAAARASGPLVDVIEVSGVVDRPMQRYIIDRIDSAERDKVSLLVLELSSLGGLKIVRDGSDLAPFIERVASSSVPVATWIGPRRAVAGGAASLVMAYDDISAMTPSARLFFTAQDSAHPSSAPAPVAARHALGTYIGATQALDEHLVDHVVPGLANLFDEIDGTVVQTSAGPVTLSLPTAQTTVRFFQAGPIRRLLHAFANPALVYITLVAGALLLAFELFQPGFGVAGWTAGLLFLGAGYGLTVLPVRWYGLLSFCLGVVLLIVDVVRDELYIPTALGTVGFVAGSLTLLPGGSDAIRLSPWLIGFCSAATVVFFIPVMTWVRRARRTIDPELRRQLVGVRGQVRSMLNPEGFVWVQDELWRARSEDGSKVRSGEPVEVASVDGTVLVVRAPVA